MKLTPTTTYKVKRYSAFSNVELLTLMIAFCLIGAILESQSHLLAQFFELASSYLQSSTS